MKQEQARRTLEEILLPKLQGEDETSNLAIVGMLEQHVGEVEMTK